MQDLAHFFISIAQLLSQPVIILVLFCSTFMGIIFGAMPGLTATLGVALLTTLTYSFNESIALVSLLAMYVGAVYGGSYTAILLNIPGTAASAATAMDGYPMAQRDGAGRVLGLTTTASAIGTIIGMLFVVLLSPLITKMALQFTSFEYFLLALFGIIISGTLTSSDLVIKGWIAGLIGLWMSTIGRDQLLMYPRFTFGNPNLDSGLEVVAVLIGAFGIPQIITALRARVKLAKPVRIKRVLPEFGTMLRNLPTIIRSSLIGVGIGAVPGIGEDIAGWVSYGTAKKFSKTPDEFGTGLPEAVISTETSNNACIGGAMIPLLTLGIPGSPPAMMLLGALMLHNITPGPMLLIENPNFIIEVAAILLLASVSMWICGITLARYVTRILEVPQTLFMPVIGLLCVIGSYALGLKIFNLFLMLPIGLLSYFLIQMKYPIAPLVIGVILGPMADTSLRRALMVSQGSIAPIFERPVSLALFSIIVLLILSQIPWFKSLFGRVQREISSKFHHSH
ncbi:transporter [Alginatibacterium sediminis]|uniref:Transporter n=1 Tax=Alginatibacterium sediminis TaxID=2164068 RepID=A0A420EHV1_9ALTE|nr:tripartite tricarboxylate transporter permease [Alginatibacterium sediminis]RKF20275.1 transporter [Alginatibacterium sediminis]